MIFVLVIVSDMHIFVLQVNESMAANSHVDSNTSYSRLQKAEHTAWKNELVRMMDLFTPLFQLPFSSPPPSLIHVVLSINEISAIP